MSYGQLTDSSPECVYPEDDSKVGIADEYDILVTEEDSLDWVYGTHPTTQAVTCSLQVGAEADCYLGQGVYSDGICVEVSISHIVTTPTQPKIQRDLIKYLLYTNHAPLLN